MKGFIKRMGAFLTASAMLTVMTGNLSACNKKETISVGSFLNKTASAFGMANYTATKPYFDNIDSSNVYYEVVQMAGDRNAFAEYSSLDLEEPITQEMAALVLVNVSDMPEYCETDSDVKIRNKKKLLNEEKINIAVSNDLFELSSFDNSFKKDKEISESEAIKAIDKAVEIWANREYEDKLEYEVEDGVIDLSAGDDAISADDFYYVPTFDDSSSENNDDNISAVDDVVLSPELSSKILESEGTEFDGSSITLPNGKTLSKGDTYLLPATKDSSMQAFVVDDITTEGENIVISNNPVDNKSASSDGDDILFDDVFKNLEQMGTISSEEMDLTQYHITDGLGNELEWIPYDNSNSSTQDSENLSCVQDGSIVSLCNYVPNSSIVATPLVDVYGKKDAELGYLYLSFKVDDIQIKGKIEKNSISISAGSSKEIEASGGKIEGQKWAKETWSGKGTVGWEKSLSISDISVNYGVRTSWGKLEWAELVTNYKTTDTTKVSTKFDAGSILAPPYTNGNGKFLTNLNRSIWKDPNSKGAKSIKICSIPCITVGPASLNLVVRINIGVSGEISLTFETECSKGFKYENGNFNFVNNEKKTQKAELKGKIEATLAVGAALMICGKNTGEVDCEFGAGCAISLTQYLIDENNALREKIDNVSDTPPQVADELLSMTFESDDGKHTLKTDYCFDISAYFIVRISIPGDCYIGKKIGSQSHSFCNEKNATFFSSHWENGSYVGKNCTKDYKETIEEETTVTTDENSTIQTYAPEEKEAPSFAKEDYGNEEVKKPLSATMYLNMEIGESAKIEITSLPDGYSASDVIFTSENADIVSVDSNGSVTAKSEGTTIIQIKTNDNKFETACTIIVKMS